MLPGPETPGAVLLMFDLMGEGPVPTFMLPVEPVAVLEVMPGSDMLPVELSSVLSEPAEEVFCTYLPLSSRLGLVEFMAVALLVVGLLPVEPVAVIPGPNILLVELGSVLLG